MYNEQKAKLMAIYRNIYRGDDPHGSFLTAFAKAYVLADMENERILMPAAIELEKKYNLEQLQRDRCILTPSQYTNE